MWPLLLATLTLVAFVLRLVHIQALSNVPVFSVLLGDSRRYVEWAAEIAGGDWLGSGAFYQAPLYPYLMAMLFGAFGTSIEIVRLAQAVLGAAACVLVAIAGRQFFGWRAGLVAGALLAVYPPALFFDGHVQKASLDVFLMALLLVAVAGYQAGRRVRWLVLLGVTLGAFTLSRENARLLYPVLAGWLLMSNRHAIAALGRGGGQPLAIFTLAVLLPIAPFVLRNYRATGELLISTSQFGPNFYIGNRRGASGVYDPLLPDRGSVIYEQEDATRLASAAAGRPLSAGEVSSYWFRLAVSEIRNDPLSWIRLTGRKLRLALNTVETMDTESIEFHATRSTLLRALMPISFGVILPLAAAGVVLTANDARRLVVLYCIGAMFLASVVLFFVLARYRHALVPLVVLFAGAGIVNIVTAWRERRRPLTIAATVALAVALVVNQPLRATTDESAANFGAELIRLDRPSDAVPLLLEALQERPDDVVLRRDLALAYLKSGDAVAATREYATVTRLEPTVSANHRELAIAAEAAGDAETMIASLREAARLDANVSARLRLGDALGRLGRAADAKAAYEGALSSAGVSPQDAVGLRVRIAFLEVADGRIDRARVLLEEALAIARSSGQTSVATDVAATIKALRGRATSK